MNNHTQIYTQAQITERVEEMAKEITDSYPENKPLLAVCVIKGAVLFYADLVKAIKDRDVRFGFVAASSYYNAEGGRMQSTGIVNMKFIPSLMEFRCIEHKYERTDVPTKTD